MFGRDTILADLQLVRPLPRADDDNELSVQVRLCKLLGVAFALSLMGLSGLGSLVALIQGLRARRIIKQHQGRLGGAILAWWCIVVGALGLFVAPATILDSLWKYLK